MVMEILEISGNFKSPEYLIILKNPVITINVKGHGKVNWNAGVKIDSISAQQIFSKLYISPGPIH